MKVFALVCAVAVVSACVSQDQEVQLGQQESAAVDSQLPMLRDPVIDAYVDSLGQAIAAKTPRADLHWHFAVVNTDVVNAFALPGGYIYIDRGILSRADNESEAASVLGHEIEHVVLRHSVKQIEQRQGASLGVGLACRLTNICSSTLGQAAIQIGGAAAFARFSRADEIQADEGGFQNLMNAGIDPRGMLTFFEKLLQEEQSADRANVLSWFADHPGTQDRVADVKRMVAEEPAGALDGLRKDSRGFQVMKAELGRLPAAPVAQDSGGPIRRP